MIYGTVIFGWCPMLFSQIGYSWETEILAEKMYRPSWQSAFPSWQCKTSGNLHQPAMLWGWMDGNELPFKWDWGVFLDFRSWLLLRAIPSAHERNALREVLPQWMGKFLYQTSITLWPPSTIHYKKSQTNQVGKNYSKMLRHIYLFELSY